MRRTVVDNQRPDDRRTPGPAQPGLLRSMNNRVVLDLLIKHGKMSRSDVHALTGLSKPTSSQLLQRLEDSGLILPGGLGDTGPGGRAPQLYRINPRAGHAAAVDVRPERSWVRVADITGTIVVERQQDVDPALSGPEDIARLLRECCETVGISTNDLNALVVGAPGSYDPDEDVLRYADHLPAWSRSPVGAELRALFEGTPVSIENDVNLAAIAEQHASESSAASFFLLWLDEGIGGALMINGSLYRGSRGAAGEVAFLIPPKGQLDEHSRTSGALERLVGSHAMRQLADDLGHPAPTAADALRALLDDAAARKIVDDIARHYALALASVISLVDPARIVLGGELARIGGERLRSAVAAQLDLVVLAAPTLELAVVDASPVLDGAMLMSLDVARDTVFAT